MSVSPIATNTLMQYNTQNVQNSAQLFRQEFQQLGRDLQSGKLSAAQQDYTNMQQGIQSYPAHKHGHGHHLGAYQNSNEMSQLFQQLGEALQSGNIATAQSAYSAMLQEFEQLSAGGIAATQPLPSASNLSLNA